MRILYRKLVRQVLEEVPLARGSDDLLFCEVIRRLGTNLDSELESSVVEAFSSGIGVNYDSVRRSRQRVQELYPELKPPERITALREDREEQIITELYEEEHHNG